ncbi:DUF3592 domain-containing protein [Streptomyces sp. T-3]|nr:DUF3592 domain-containing protein [Streptomyces sp. T-3]
MQVQFQLQGRGAGRWFGFGAIVFGSLFLVAAVILAGMSVSDLANAERAQGRVVALEWRNDDSGTSRKQHGNDEPAAYPVVEFTSADGIPRTFKSSFGSNPPSYEEGEQVEVLYDADSPEDAQINGFASLWLLPLLFGGIGVLIAGIGAVVARRARS